jgi:hypothetical protein
VESDNGRWQLLKRGQARRLAPLQRHLLDKQAEEEYAAEEMGQFDAEPDEDLDLQLHLGSLSDEQEPPARSVSARARLRQQRARTRAAAERYAPLPIADTPAAAEVQGWSDEDGVESDAASDSTAVWQTGGEDAGNSWDLDCWEELDPSFAETFGGLGAFGAESAAADSGDPSKHPRGLRELRELQQHYSSNFTWVGNTAYESLAAAAAEQGSEEEDADSASEDADSALQAADSMGTPGVQLDPVTVLSHAFCPLLTPDAGAEEGLETFESIEDEEPCNLSGAAQATAIGGNGSSVAAVQQHARSRSSYSTGMSSSRQAGS